MINGDIVDWNMKNNWSVVSEAIFITPPHIITLGVRQSRVESFNARKRERSKLIKICYSIKNYFIQVKLN